jgi:hypothetical protein
MDKDLTPVERTLAAVAMDVAGAVEARNDGYWPEDLIPPLVDGDEGDVLQSALYTRPGSPEPRAGFTLHDADGNAYRVIIEPFPEVSEDVEESEDSGEIAPLRGRVGNVSWDHSGDGSSC